MSHTSTVALSREDHRHVRASLIAVLAAAFTIAFGTFGFAQVESPSADRAPALSSAPPAAASASPAEETTNESVGCGCAEGCRS